MGLSMSASDDYDELSVSDASKADTFGVDGKPLESRSLTEFLSPLALRSLRRGHADAKRGSQIAQWAITSLVGVLTALVGGAAALGVEGLNDWKYDQVVSVALNRTMEETPGMQVVDTFLTFAAFLGINLGLVLAASAMVLVFEPVCAGSGICEIKCALNGLHLPRVVNIKTLFVKLIALILVCSSSMPVGKEGPMIHIGAIIAANLSEIGRLRCLSRFSAVRDDHIKGEFIACGAACGIAVAFGAPLGGVLFALEEASSFWHQMLTWRVFFSTMVAITTLRLVLTAVTNENSSGLLVFGSFSDVGLKDQYTLYEIPLFLLLGVMGGALGAAFNMLNRMISVRRARIYGGHTATNSKFKRFLECAAVSLMVSGLAFMGKVNLLASLTMSGSETAIKQLLHSPVDFGVGFLLLFGVYHYFMACFTFGLAIPGGVFVPTILAGCAMGRIVGEIVDPLMEVDAVNSGTYALMGAAAMMGGVTRMTVSLAVILIEVTGNVQYALPLMLVLMSSKFTGDLIIDGLYDVHIELRRWAFLEEEEPANAAFLPVSAVMNPRVQQLPVVCTVQAVLDVLLADNERANAFAVVSRVQVVRDSQSSSIFKKAEDRTAHNSPSSASSSSSSAAAAYAAAAQSPDESTSDQPEESVPQEEAEEGVPVKPTLVDVHVYRGYLMRHHLLGLLAKSGMHSTEAEALSVQEGKAAPRIHWKELENNQRTIEKKGQHSVQQLSAVELAADLDEEARGMWLCLSPYMHHHAPNVFCDTTVKEAFHMFRTLGLRHLFVLGHDFSVRGLITRKDLTAEALESSARNAAESFRDTYGPHDADAWLPLMAMR